VKRRALSFSLLLAVACGPAPELPPLPANAPLVERTGASEVVIRWDDIPNGASVPVYLGSSPRSIDRAQPIAMMSAPSLAVDGLAPGERPFFELAPPGAAPRIVAERLLPLEGSHNFRDLGGYETADGRFVRWGMLYRSDDLADLGDADLAYLEKLRIRWLCDFRSSGERADEPDRLPATDPPAVENLAITGIAMPRAELKRRIMSGDLDDIDIPGILLDGNRSFATTFAHRYRTLFERIADPANLPALIHCTAGKDRTGLGAALILMALGVPRETAFADYLLTNRFTREQTERTLLFIRIVSFFRTDPELLRPLFGVRREYLQAAFAAIEERHGSVDVYLREELGVTDLERGRLREMLLR
jgi:protein-tyrosine phosphatase